MLLDLIALGILAVFIALGALRGGVASGASVASLALSYAASWWGARALGEPLAEQLGLPGLAGPPLAGSVIFLVSFVLLGAGSALLRSWDRRRRHGRGRGLLDRLAGACFGAVRGALLVVLLAWLALWLDAARSLGGPGMLAALPETQGSAVAQATGQLVEQAVEAALADSGPGRSLAARLAARPRATLEHLQGVLDDPRIRSVQDDAMFWKHVENGAVQNALNRASFWDVVNDAPLRRQLGELGLIDEAAATDAGAFREAAADLLQALGPRLKGLAEDSEVQRLAHDPEIAALLRSGDTLGLLRHPAVRRLVTRVSEGL